MNIILFHREELDRPLLKGDSRFDHITQILRSSEGDILKGGILNGPFLDLKIEFMDREQILYSHRELALPPPPLYPITLIMGTPRPPTARRLLKDLTTLGAGRLIFTGTDLNEKSYLTSKLWLKNGYLEAMMEGAQQGGSTLMPEVLRFYSLKKSLESLGENPQGIYLEGDRTYPVLDKWLQDFSGQNLTIALGPERGWTDREITMLKETGFQGVNLGDRIFRTETAAVSSASQVIQYFLR